MIFIPFNYSINYACLTPILGNVKLTMLPLDSGLGVLRDTTMVVKVDDEVMTHFIDVTSYFKQLFALPRVKCEHPYNNKLFV